jgi:hypothetical protein
MAIADEALLHSVLAYTLMYSTCLRTNSMMRPSQLHRFLATDLQFLHHELQAVRLINKKLKEGSISDAAIAAVMVLTMRHGG